jgi:hypothetical protein
MKLLLIPLKNHFIKIVTETIAEKYLSKGNFILMMTKATKPKKVLETHTIKEEQRHSTDLLHNLFIY